MGDTHKYYLDFTKERKGIPIKYRLLILPGSDSGAFSDQGSAPSFGGSPTDSVYIRIPDNVINAAPEQDEAGFDSLPIGFPKLPTLKLNINATALDTTADLTYLLASLISPKKTGVIFIEAGRLLDTYTTVILYSDKGDVGASVYQSTLGVFCVKVDPTNKFETDGSGQAFVQVTATHLVSHLLETLKASDLKAMIESEIDTSHITLLTDKERVIHDIWKYDDDSTIATRQREETLEAVGKKFHAIRLVDIWVGVRNLLRNTIPYFVRDDANVSFNSFASVLDYDDEPIGTPFDSWRLFKRTLERDNSKGSQLGTAYCYVNYRAYFEDAATPEDEEISGYVSVTGSGNVFSFSSLLDYLHDALEFSLMRARVSFSLFDLTIDFLRVKEGTQIDVDATDISGEDGKASFEQGAGRIFGAQCTPLQKNQGDPESVSSIDGSEDSAKLTNTALLDNLPDADDLPTEIDLGSEVIYGEVESIEGAAQWFTISSASYRESALMYLSTDYSHAMLDAQLFAVHSYCELDDGVTIHTADLETFDKPQPDSTGGTNTSAFAEAVLASYSELQSQYVAAQFSSSMLHVTTKAARAIFGTGEQVGYSLVIHIPVFIGEEEIGNMISATSIPSPEVFSDLSVLTGLAGNPVIVKAKPNYENSTVSIMALGV